MLLKTNKAVFNPLSIFYLETDPESFEVFHKKLYLNLARKYHPLLGLVTSVHFRWQLTVMWIFIKCRPTHDSAYDYIRRAMLTPPLNKDTIALSSKSNEFSN